MAIEDKLPDEGNAGGPNEPVVKNGGEQPEGYKALWFIIACVIAAIVLAMCLNGCAPAPESSNGSQSEQSNPEASPQSSRT